MATEIWSATVKSVGADAADMIDAGVYILFAEPVPPALSDMSIVHDQLAPADFELRAGDTFVMGDVEVTVDEVGSIAAKNLTDLGHTVIYLNSPGQKLLPGAVKATGDTLTPQVGQTIAFRR